MSSSQTTVSLNVHCDSLDTGGTIDHSQCCSSFLPGLWSPSQVMVSLVRHNSCSSKQSTISMMLLVTLVEIMSAQVQLDRSYTAQYLKRMSHVQDHGDHSTFECEIRGASCILLNLTHNRMIFRRSAGLSTTHSREFMLEQTPTG